MINIKKSDIKEGMWLYSISGKCFRVGKHPKTNEVILTNKEGNSFISLDEFDDNMVSTYPDWTIESSFIPTNLFLRGINSGDKIYNMKTKKVYTCFFGLKDINNVS